MLQRLCQTRRQLIQLFRMVASEPAKNLFAFASNT